MSSTPRTSIIMPVYNTASTVIAAIESVLAQTDPDFELLVMIDGSPDDSAQLIADYLQRNADERVRVFDNPENRGPSAVRNQGLDAARGAWVAFLDSDDTLYPTFLERLHHHAERTGAQVVNCAHTMVSTDGTTTQRLKGAPGTLTGQQAAFALLKDELSPYPWDKLIDRSLLEGVYFPEDIRRAEDECVILDCYLRAQSVTVIDEPLYAYAVNAGSLTWSRITPLAETRRLLDYFAKSLQRTSTYHLPEGQEALTVARVLAYLNNAQQALIVGGEDAPATLAGCRRGFSVRDALLVLRQRPVFGAAGLLLKPCTGFSTARTSSGSTTFRFHAPTPGFSLITLTQIGANLCPLCLHRRRWRPLPPRIPSPTADRLAGPPRIAPSPGERCTWTALTSSPSSASSPCTTGSTTGWITIRRAGFSRTSSRVPRLPPSPSFSWPPASPSSTSPSGRASAPFTRSASRKSWFPC